MIHHEHSISPYTLDHSVQTYGMYASVKQVNDTLRVDEKVRELPDAARVLNVGSGPYLGMSALIHTLRPDVTIVNIDPGYIYEQPSDVSVLEGMDASYIQRITERVPRTDGDQASVAGLVEHLPFADETFDYIFGHASVPQNMLQTPGNQQAVLKSLSRVAKRGATIDLGPLQTHIGDSWQEALDKSVDDNLFASAKLVDTKVYIDYYDCEIAALTTRIER